MSSTPREGKGPRQPTAYGKIAKVGVLWAVGQQAGAQLMQIGAGVALARLLTPLDFGIAAAVGFFLRLANKLTSIGFGSALVRMKEVRAEHLSSVFVVSLGMSVTMWAVLTLSAPALARLFHHDEIGPALRLGALIYLLLPFGVGQAAELNRQFRFRAVAGIEWTYSVTFCVVAIGLALAGNRYWSLIWATLLANAAATVIKIYLGGVQPRLRFSRAAFMEVIPFGTGVQAKRILTFCGEYLDNLVVGRVLGLTALGYYDKAFSTVDRVVDRLAAGPSVFFRIFSLIRDDAERMRRAYRKAVMASSLLGFPAFAVLIVLGPELIPFMYGDQWESSILPFQILCLAGAFRVSSAYAGAATQAKGRIWSEIARLVFYLALVLTGAYVGARWGIVGVAVGIAAANGVMSLLMQTLVCRLTALRWREVFGSQVPALCMAALIAVAMASGQWMLSTMEPGAARWQHLLLKLAIACAFGLLLFLKPPFQSVRDVRNEVLQDLTPNLIRYLPVWAGAVPADSGRAGARRIARPAAEAETPP